MFQTTNQIDKLGIQQDINDILPTWYYDIQFQWFWTKKTQWHQTIADRFWEGISTGAEKHCSHGTGFSLRPQVKMEGLKDQNWTAAV